VTENDGKDSKRSQMTVMLWVKGTLGVLNKAMELNTCNTSKAMTNAMQVV